MTYIRFIMKRAFFLLSLSLITFGGIEGRAAAQADTEEGRTHLNRLFDHLIEHHKALADDYKNLLETVRSQDADSIKREDYLGSQDFLNSPESIARDKIIIIDQLTDCMQKETDQITIVKQEKDHVIKNLRIGRERASFIEMMRLISFVLHARHSTPGIPLSIPGCVDTSAYMMSRRIAKKELKRGIYGLIFFKRPLV